MCSIATNSTAEAQLQSLTGKDNTTIEKKLREFAGDSNVQKSGILDLPANHLYGFPADLKHIRRRRTGRHRVFYVGHHTQCSYQVFYIKKFKDTGVNDELDPQFHKVLRRAVGDESLGRIIRPPDDEGTT